MCSIETGREFFAKDWFSGMPYSSSNLQGTLYRLSGRRKVRWGGGKGESGGGDERRDWSEMRK